MRAFRAQHPDEELDLHGELFTPEQVARILDGKLDVGFVRPPAGTADLEVEVIRREPLVALLPEGHPLADHPRIRLEDLAGEPFIAYPNASVMNQVVLEACLQAGFTPQPIQGVHETITMVCFVAAGLGVALAPASVRHVHVTRLAYRELEAPPEVTLAVAWRRDNHSPVLDRFLSVVHSLGGL